MLFKIGVETGLGIEKNFEFKPVKPRLKLNLYRILSIYIELPWQEKPTSTPCDIRNTWKLFRPY